MIGDIVIIGYDHYVKSNTVGTIERLPDIPWYRQLQIFFLNYSQVMSIGEVRDFYKRHTMKGVI